MNFLPTAILSLLTLATIIVAVPNPICSGLCTGTIRDPAVLRRNDGTWLRYTTEGNLRIATAPSSAALGPARAAKPAQCSPAAP
jgi:arabinan endo-1,5-alpha-L-arabinosidase